MFHKQDWPRSRPFRSSASPGPRDANAVRIRSSLAHVLVALDLAERLQIKGTQIGDGGEIALLGLPFSTVCHDCLYNGVHAGALLSPTVAAIRADITGNECHTVTPPLARKLHWSYSVETSSSIYQLQTKASGSFRTGNARMPVRSSNITAVPYRRWHAPPPTRNNT